MGARVILRLDPSAKSTLSAAIRADYYGRSNIDCDRLATVVRRQFNL